MSVPQIEKEFPRRFVPDSIDLGDWKQIEPLFQDLRKRRFSTVKALERWIGDVGELSSCLSEESSRRYIAMTCDTRDEKAEKRFLQFLTEIQPKLKPHFADLDRKYLRSRVREKLDREKYFVFDRDIRNEVLLFRKENVPLETEDDEFQQAYQKTCGAMTVVFDGEEKTLPQMRKYLEVTDRDVRDAAWRKVAERYFKDRSTLGELYDRMVRIRHRMAVNAGFKNYRDYIHLRKGRFDYSPEDCFRFHDAVEAYVVPLNRKIAESRRKKLRIDRLRPWDMEADPEGRDPLKPFESSSELIEKTQRIIRRIDGKLADRFLLMKEKKLLDLESRKGKAPGGYQAGLAEVRYPFIFMNAAGTDRDVYTLLHESGHAFHLFERRNQPLAVYRENVPMEFCEVASMSMELFGLAFLDVFYSEQDAERSRNRYLEGILKLLAWIATIDAFQHAVYEHPDWSPEDREDEWIRIRSRFDSGVDWSGFEEFHRTLWHRQLHLFTAPFYYIEYGIAQLGALQLWFHWKRAPKRTIDRYRRALAAGGSRSLADLFALAGIRLPFHRKTVAALVKKVAIELNL